MNTATSKTIPLLLRPLEAVAKWRPTFKLRVPVGYQDENGFHYGVKPAGKKITWPPVS